MGQIGIDENFRTLDQLVRRRAETHADQVLLSYPRHELDFVDYTGRDIELLTRIAASRYAKELSHVHHSPGSTVKIALVGASSLAYYIAFLAIQRLGLTTIFISPRLADQGFAHLFKTTGCHAVVVAEALQQTIDRVLRTSDVPLVTVPMLNVEGLNDNITEGGCDFPEVDVACRQEFIIHSGGTTGLPKPVPLQPASWLAQAAAIAKRMPKVDTLSTLPLFHSFGLATLLRCLVNGRKLAILNASRPITAPVVSAAIDSTGSKALVTVPYILKFFGEMEGAIERLAALRQVVAAGSAIPDDLGDSLVAAGVSIFHLYGLTEAGALMEPSKDQWNWVTPLPHAEPFLKFEPFGENLHHLVVLSGLKAKVYSDGADGSYATKDLFQSHPTDPRKWKFISRKDDIIVLLNGEKADPTPLEEAVMQNANVKAAVVFGAQRQSLGMIVIRSDQADSMNDGQLIESLRPALDMGNSRVPAYARIASDAIIVKKPDTSLPRTDKATIIRMQALQQFSQDIEDFYAKQEQSCSSGRHQTTEDVREFVRETVRQSLRLDGADASFSDTSDFFDLGMDSLQASNVRSRLIRELGLGSIATNVVFDHPNVELLVQHLLSCRHGTSRAAESDEAIAAALVSKYSRFSESIEGNLVVQGKTVLLTGATGTIGVHLLQQLLQNQQVTTVYCLVRSPESGNAHSRIVEALGRACLYETLIPEIHLTKIQAVPCDFSDENLGLSDSFLAQARSNVTHIIHNAWSVNFNQSVRSFERQSIRSTHFLLDLAAQSSLQCKPAFTFVSSIAAALRSSISDPIPEAMVPWSSAETIGYGQSKWVAEQIAAAAAENCHVPVRIVRVGQVCGDTAHGMWNPSEAIPTTVQAAQTIGALPLIENGDEELAWLPVDVAAKSLTILAMLDGKEVPGLRVFHVVNTRGLRWNAEFLPYLKSNGLIFEAVPASRWVQRLESSEQDVELNPPVKLLEFYRNKYGKTDKTVNDPVFDVVEAGRYVPTLKDGVHISEELVSKFSRFWTR